MTESSSIGSTLTRTFASSAASHSSSVKAEFAKKEQLRCMMCGGKDCSNCGLDAHKVLTAPAIAGLHSHWINDCILAMQRPNDTALDNGALADMVAQKITAVFNLTEPGEHPYCGTGVLPASGFPYSPEKLMHAGIKHFNFSWQDMTVPTLPKMFDIVSIAVAELTNGGKIAVHCHAGFGRTGLTVACILIAKDLLEASQVIQFVRNRRPGSIQTVAQQQFVHKFEKALHLRMQVFPLIELDPNNHYGRRKSIPTLNLKTIKLSVQDQQHFLSPAEMANHRYKYIHKVVHYTTTTINRLAHEHFIIACLAITGLTRLTIKKNLELETTDESIARNVMPTMTASKSARRLVRKKSSFMVATNSLSESGEENILTDVKHELNVNKWTRLFSIADVLAANLEANPIADNDNSGETIQSFTNLRRRMSLSGDDSSMGPGSSIAAAMAIAAAAAGGGGKQSPPSTPLSTPVSSPQHSQPPVRQMSMLSTGQSNGALQVVEEDGESATPSVPVQQSTSLDNDTTNSLPTLDVDSGGSKESPNKSAEKASRPPHMELSVNSNDRAQSDRKLPSSPNSSRGGLMPVLSMSRLRSNSLRIISEADFAKSKRMAVNLIAQLLLDWLETRQHALLNEEMVNHLGDIWKLHGKNHFQTAKKSDDHIISRQSSGHHLMMHRDSSRNLMSRAHSLLNNDNKDNNRHLDMDPFNMSVKMEAPSELTAEISNYLHSHLDRYGMEMLNALVTMYKRLRRAGREIVHSSAPSQHNTARSTGSANGGAPHSMGMEEYEALEALVGLRLAIALMHARKQYHGLIRQRALVIDLVKVFLLKSTNSELVIINNITFSEESFEHVKNTMGTNLIYQLDVVFRTLRLLSDEEWKKPNEKQHTVHWRPDGISKATSTMSNDMASP